MKLKRMIKRLFLSKTARSEEKTILIIDDSKERMEFLTSALTKKGYRVLTGIDEKIFKENDKGDLLNLVIINATIRGNKSVDLCGKIKTDPQTRSVPVLVFADNRENIKSIEFYDKGIDYFMTWTFSETDLLKQIEILLFPDKAQASA